MIGAWIDKGLNLERLGRHEEAIESNDAALQINPKHEGALYSKVVSLLNSKKYSEALSAFVQALQLNAEDVNAWFGEGLSLAHLRRYDEAIEASRDGLNVDAWNNIGELQIALRQNQQAILALNHVTTLDPQNYQGVAK
jgi:tetratricopeptide (TPR) repeat protein